MYTPVFKEHTRWISKGKAGRAVELGVPLAIIEDQHQFVLDHWIMWEGGDVDVAVPLVESCQAMYPDLRECSFDRGFHSPANRKRLDELLDTAALPKKGRLNAADPGTGVRRSLCPCSQAAPRRGVSNQSSGTPRA